MNKVSPSMSKLPSIHIGSFSGVEDVNHKLTSNDIGLKDQKNRFSQNEDYFEKEEWKSKISTEKLYDFANESLQTYQENSGVHQLDDGLNDLVRASNNARLNLIEEFKLNIAAAIEMDEKKKALYDNQFKSVLGVGILNALKGSFNKLMFPS
jgi:hypothetical protein